MARSGNSMASRQTRFGTAGSARSRCVSRGRWSSEHASTMEEPAQRTDQGCVVGLDDRWPGDDENVPAGLERGRHHPERLSKPAPDPVPDDRSAELSPGRQSEPRRLEVCPQESRRHERVGPTGPGALNRREILRTREHHETRRVGAAPVSQAVSRFRPRARRAAITRRPLDVRMRARKPCSLARWRFLGWYVRFIGSVRDPLRSSPGRRSPPPKGTQTRLAPVSAHARSSSGG